MYFPAETGDIPACYVSLPEGIKPPWNGWFVGPNFPFLRGRFQDFHAAVTFHDFTLVPLSLEGHGDMENSSLPVFFFFGGGGLAIKMCLENLGKYHFC